MGELQWMKPSSPWTLSWLVGFVVVWLSGHSPQLEFSEKRNFSWENASIRLASRLMWGSIFLINDLWKRAQHSRVGPPGQVALGSIRKQAERAKGSKPRSSTPPWPLLQLLPPNTYPVRVPVLTFFDDQQWCGNVSQINRFPLQLDFSQDRDHLVVKVSGHNKDLNVSYLWGAPSDLVTSWQYHL